MHIEQRCETDQCQLRFPSLKNAFSTTSKKPNNYNIIDLLNDIPNANERQNNKDNNQTVTEKPPNQTQLPLTKTLKVTPIYIHLQYPLLIFFFLSRPLDGSRQKVQQQIKPQTNITEQSGINTLLRLTNKQTTTYSSFSPGPPEYHVVHLENHNTAKIHPMATFPS